MARDLSILAHMSALISNDSHIYSGYIQARPVEGRNDPVLFAVFEAPYDVYATLTPAVYNDPNSRVYALKITQPIEGTDSHTVLDFIVEVSGEGHEGIARASREVVDQIIGAYRQLAGEQQHEREQSYISAFMKQ